MSNGKCAVGAGNRQAIEDLQAWVGTLGKKLDRIELWLVGVLGAMVLNLVVMVGKWLVQAAHAK